MRRPPRARVQGWTPAYRLAVLHQFRGAEVRAGVKEEGHGIGKTTERGVARVPGGSGPPGPGREQACRRGGRARTGRSGAGEARLSRRGDEAGVGRDKASRAGDDKGVEAG